MSYQVDTAAMGDIAGTLRTGRNAIEQLAESCPGVPDGGELTVEMGKLLKLFVGEAGELSSGVAAAADTVDDCARTYADTDASAQQEISSVNI